MSEALQNLMQGLHLDMSQEVRKGWQGNEMLRAGACHFCNVWSHLLNLEGGLQATAATNAFILQSTSGIYLGSQPVSCRVQSYYSNNWYGKVEVLRLIWIPEA